MPDTTAIAATSRSPKAAGNQTRFSRLPLEGLHAGDAAREGRRGRGGYATRRAASASGPPVASTRGLSSTPCTRVRAIGSESAAATARDVSVAERLADGAADAEAAA